MKELIKYPVATEKAMRLMESENKLVFVVSPDATKPEIKKILESMFKIKITDVKTHTSTGEKRAIVTLSKETPAIDIATNLGLM